MRHCTFDVLGHKRHPQSVQQGEHSYVIWCPFMDIGSGGRRISHRWLQDTTAAGGELQTGQTVPGEAVWFGSRMSKSWTEVTQLSLLLRSTVDKICSCEKKQAYGIGRQKMKTNNFCLQKLWTEEGKSFFEIALAWRAGELRQSYFCRSSVDTTLMNVMIANTMFGTVVVAVKNKESTVNREPGI